jgi:hypothetical protein
MPRPPSIGLALTLISGEQMQPDNEVVSYTAAENIPFDIPGCNMAFHSVRAIISVLAESGRITDNVTRRRSTSGSLHMATIERNWVKYTNKLPTTLVSVYNTLPFFQFLC